MSQQLEVPSPLFHYAAVARQAAREAGVILKAMLLTAKVHEKSPKDLVTDADVAAQQSIQKILATAFPSHGFVGEEENASKDLSKMSGRLCWVVDPIDGTANYVHHLNNFAVSIALVDNSIPIVGVVYDPMADELFCGVKRFGATMNDRPIRASDCTSLDRALIAASFPPNIKHGAIEIEQFINVLIAAQSIRRLGSAALNLCYVGCGRLDGYWAGKVRPWDIAAGVLIAEEAGAVLTARDGSMFSLQEDNLAVCSTHELHTELVGTLNSSQAA